MKNRFKIIVIIILLCVIASCQHDKVKRIFYDTGELRGEEYLIDREKQISYCKEFYKNGKIEDEGTSNKEGLRVGHWKEYYSDGKLKWKGEFEAGQRVILKRGDPEFIDRKPNIEIDGHPQTLKVGHKYKFRTYVEGLDLTMYIVTYSNFKEVEVNKEDPDRYPYCFIPNKSGNFQILYLFPDDNGYIITDSPHFSFNFKVEE
jgi:hypothetical protein